MNRLIGQKISITSRRPQTTRYQIRGVLTQGPVQLIFLDTPGMEVRPRGVLNRAIFREAIHAMEGVDCLVFVVEPKSWNAADESVFNRIASAPCPVVLLINKVDRLKDKRELLPIIGALAKKREWAAICPVSATTGDNLPGLIATLSRLMPEGEHVFAEDQITDRSERFLAAEVVREKLTRLLGDELPYHLTVLVDNFVEEEGRTRIDTTIWVERDGQKAIVIGKGGARLKQVGELARADLEAMLERHVFLGLWVKVKEDWVEDGRLVRQIGLGGR
jgi:GTP-binding protein Era